MSRFVRLKQSDGETVIVNVDRIDIIQDEDHRDRTKITMGSLHLFVKEAATTIIEKSCFESNVFVEE